MTAGYGRKRKRKRKGNSSLPMYVFNHSKGKKLTVDFNSSRDVSIRSFSRGRVNVLRAKKGRFALSNILKPNHTMDIIDPSFMSPRSLKVIRTGKDRSEKVFDITPKGKLPRKTLKFGMNSTGTGLFIQNRGQAGLNLSIASRKIASNGIIRKLPLKTMNIPGGKNQLLNLK